VAQQIQDHVVAALRDAEHRARIAQFEHDLGMAKSIQQGLLPTEPPCLAGFEVAGWNRPADETGGDYFDWQQLTDGRVAVTIADVTGHGVGPALIMSACRAYARAGYALEGNLQTLASRLNRLLCEDLPEGKFVTFAAGLLDPQYRTLKLISAGHGPLIFYSAAQSTFYSMDAQGPPLGLLDNISYGEPYSLRFESGDMLVLITDGFLEWTNETDEEFGLQRLQEVIRANRDKPAAAIISAMYSSIVNFVGSAPQTDDLTALIVRGT
jgi:serine phosphatase RsbU (regulator of sigma subunit)